MSGAKTVIPWLTKRSISPPGEASADFLTDEDRS